MHSFLAVGTVILGAVLLQAGNGILMILLPLRMNAEGLPTTSIGIVATCHAVGFLLGCLYTPKLIRGVGHIRTFAVLAAGMAICTLILTFAVDAILWGAVRVVMGFCFAGLITVSESWISERTPQEQRGSVLSTYMLLYKFGTAGGPLLLSYGDITDIRFLLAISIMFSFALVPVSLTRGRSPEISNAERLGFKAIYSLAPVSVVGCIVIGLMNSSIMNLGSPYMATIGLSVGEVAFAMAAVQAGGLASQWPLGWLSDHMDRRYIILGASLFVAAVAGLLLVLPDAPIWVTIVLFGCLGAGSLSIYAVCLAHATDLIPSDQMVAACSTLLFSWAVGSIVGPLVTGYVMSWIGPFGLFILIGLIALMLTGFVIYRLRVRVTNLPEDRDGFVGVPATSPAVVKLDPRFTKDKQPDLQPGTETKDPQ